MSALEICWGGSLLASRRVRDEQIQEGYRICSEGDGFKVWQLATASGRELEADFLR